MPQYARIKMAVEGRVAADLVEYDSALIRSFLSFSGMLRSLLGEAAPHYDRFKTRIYLCDCYPELCYEWCDEKEEYVYIGPKYRNFSCGDQFLDRRDCKEYDTVIIGYQCWMQENLDYSDHEEGESWCYYEDSSNCNTYGRLYNWEAAMEGSEAERTTGVCPDMDGNWHLPSDEDWMELEYFLGMDKEDLDEFGHWERSSGDPGKKMKEKGTDHWRTNDYAEQREGAIWSYSLFNALPGGYRHHFTPGSFLAIYDYGYWWTSTVYSDWSAMRRSLGADRAGIKRDAEAKRSGFSVRCVMD